jgi:hypothetical protein
MPLKKPWFGPKRFIGWGASPASWEGWVVTAIYILLVIVTFKNLGRNLAVGVFIGLTIILLVIIKLTGRFGRASTF